MKYLFAFFILLSPTLIFAQNDMGCSHVKGHNNTSREASNEQLDDYDVKFYGLDITLDNLSTYVEGNVTIKAKVKASTLSEFVVELVDELIIDSVFLDDTKLSFTHAEEEVVVDLGTTLSQSDVFSVKLYYHGNPETGGFFSGISNDFSQSWGNQVTWTLSEPYNAKQWWPTKQVLEDKADSAHIFITVPNHLKAGSNGVLVNEVDLPDSKKRFEWKTNYPIAYYLIAMTVGEYVEYNTEANVDGYPPILIQNYIYNNPGTLPNFQADLDEVAPMVELFSDLYGIYPFYKEKYGHVMAPFGGGMEHQTMSTMGFFDFTLNAHELGHQWFGDNVTCASWQDIWINEGFARYSEYLAQEHLRSKQEADSWMQDEYANIKESGTGSVYIPEEVVEDENRIFDFRLTYQKGGALIHMIRNILNDDDLFFDALKEYQATYADSTATGDDFRVSLESSTGLDFEEFFNDWYYGEGYPSYQVDWGYYGDTLYIEQNQTTSSSVTPLFETPLEYRINFDDGDSLFRISQSANEEIFKFYVDREVKSLDIDPGQWLIKTSSLSRSITEPEPEPVVAGVDSEVEAFSVYPNPSGGRFYLINNKAKRALLTVVDMKGVTILKQEIEADRQQLDISVQNKGIYIVQLQYRSEIIRRQLVIK